MKPEEIDRILDTTLEDLRLSRSERQALRQIVSDLDLDDEQRRFWRHRAFAIAQKAVSGAGARIDSTMEATQVLDWVEEVIKALEPAQGVREHDAADNVAVLVFTEFGRRIKDNGSGTDHGSGGGAFILGERVRGGLYAEYPPLAPAEWLNGEDLRHTIDFRGIYSTMLEQWMGLNPVEIVGGTFEQIRPFETRTGA